MALTPVCDLCKGPGPERTNRRWFNIKGEFGLEVVPLVGQKPSGETHICEKCMLEMILVKLEESPYTGLKDRMNRLARLDTREFSLKQRETEIECRAERDAAETAEQIRQLNEREIRLADQEQNAAERETLANQLLMALRAKQEEMHAAGQYDIELAEREATLKARARELDRRAIQAAATDRHLADRERLLDERTHQINNRDNSDLFDQLGIFNARHAEEIRRAEIRGKQQALDIIDANPTPAMRRVAVKNLRRQLGRF